MCVISVRPMICNAYMFTIMTMCGNITTSVRRGFTCTYKIIISNTSTLINYASLPTFFNFSFTNDDKKMHYNKGFQKGWENCDSQLGVVTEIPSI